MTGAADRPPRERTARLSLNQATIKHADLATALAVTAAARIPSIGLWREPVAAVGLDLAARMITDSGLRVSGLCRGGFFTVADPRTRRAALAENLRAIEETAVLAAAGAPGSAPVLVLVAGGLADGGRDLAGARRRVGDALAELVGPARMAGVVLAVEPMHPVYAADRGVVSTLGQALDLVEDLPPEAAGVVVDTFHVWWDPDLPRQITRAGAGRRIAAYQVGDWITPFGPDPLLSRGMLGTGHVDLAGITALVTAAGYTGDIEVEIFNQALWDADPAQVAERTARAYADTVGL